MFPDYTLASGPRRAHNGFQARLRFPTGPSLMLITVSLPRVVPGRCLANPVERRSFTPGRRQRGRRNLECQSGPSSDFGLCSSWVWLCGRESLAADDKPIGKEGPSNRLAKETSPYLLLHAHNPVDWYPWGPRRLPGRRPRTSPSFFQSDIAHATGATSSSGRVLSIPRSPGL